MHSGLHDMSGDFRVERYTSPGGPPVEAVLQGIESSSAPTLRSLEGEVARLTKTNFNLKVRQMCLSLRQVVAVLRSLTDTHKNQLRDEMAAADLLLGGEVGQVAGGWDRGRRRGGLVRGVD